MADIRIKDFATEASSPAADDYFEIDGPTNGSRKLAGRVVDNTGRAPRGGIVSAALAPVGTTPDNAVFQADPWTKGNRTGLMWLRLPVYTPAATSTYLFSKAAANLGVRLYLTQTAYLILAYGNGSNYTTYAFVSTAPITAPGGSLILLAWTEDRAGNLTFYVNATQLGAPVSIAAASAQSLATTADLAWFAFGTTYTAGTLSDVQLISGLLSASRIADISRAGSIAPFCVMTPNSVTGQNTATIDGLSFFTWPEFDRGYATGGIIPDRSGNNQHALMGTSGLFHAVRRNPPGAPQRASKSALVFDGTSGSFARCVLNSQNPGVGDLVTWDHFRVPLVAPSAPAGVYTGPLSNAISGSALARFISSTGDLVIRKYSADYASTAAYRSRIFANFVQMFGGKDVVVITRRSGSSIAIFVCTDGEAINVTNLAPESVTGTPDGWDTSIDGAYNSVSQLVSTVLATEWRGLRTYNVALTEAQVREEYLNGEPQAKWSRGSKVPIIDSSTANGGFELGAMTGWGSTGGTSTASTEQVHSGSYSAKFTANGSAGAIGLFKGTTLELGAWYGASVWIFVTAGSSWTTSTKFLASYTSNNLGALVGTIVPNTWCYFERVFQADHAEFDLYGTGAAVGDVVYYDDISLVRLGVNTRLLTDLSAVPTLLNGRAENGSGHFLTSLIGVTQSPASRRQIIPIQTLTFTAGQTLQVFGAGVIDTTKKQRIVSISGTVSAGTNLSAGNASSGAQYVSAQAITGDFDIGTFVTRRPSGANLWLTSSAACTITDAAVILEQVN